MKAGAALRLSVPVLVAALTVAPVACARDDSGKGLDVVRIAARGALTNGALHLGAEEGDFAREGIHLEFTESPRASVQVIPLLERQEIDVVAGSTGAGFYAAVAMGARSRLVADRGHAEPSACEFDGIVGSRTAFTSDSPTAREVRGKTFSINSPGTAAFIIDKYLQSLGLSESDVKVVKLPQTLEPQAMEVGSLDATHASEPYLSELRASGHRMLAGASEIAPGAHVGSLIFGPSLTVANRDLGMRFMRAYVKGARRLAEGTTPRNVELLAKRTGFDPKLLAKACLPTVSVNGTLDLDWLLEFQQWAVRKGHLDGVLGRDAGVDTAFIAAAVAKLGRADPEK